MSWRGLVWLAATAVFAGCGRPNVERVEWVVMDTVAAVQFRGGPEDRQTGYWIQDAFLKVSDEFNAFDQNSAINRLGGCSEFGKPCWDFAFRLRDQTGGVFDPRWRGKGTLDFGAVAKGFAVEAAAESLRTNSSPRQCDILLDLGGNLKSVKGDWTVGIQGSSDTLVLSNGMACATSAEYFRGKHIFDARTGNAVTNDLMSVTVVHPSSAMLADGLSTVCFILGEEEGTAFLRKHYPEAQAIWIRKEQ